MSGRKENQDFTQNNPEMEAKKDGFTKGNQNGNKNVNRKGAQRRPRTNHPTWYFRNKQTMEDCASMPWNGVLGTNVGIRTEKWTGTANEAVSEVVTQNYTFGGVLAIDFIPTYGTSAVGTYNNSLNVAAQNIYTWVRHNNSGSRNYEAPDLMMYIMGIDNLNMLLEVGKRAYGAAMVYHTQNRYYGRALIRAMGFTDDTWLNDPIKIRSFLNVCAVRIASLNAPSSENMYIFDRHAWLCSEIWKDSNSARAQLYLYHPTYFYEWSGTTSTSGTELLAKAAPTTFEQYKALMEEMINAMVLDEDAGIISGDIRKAYTSLRTVSMVPEDYRVFPAYDEAALTQLQNTTLAPYGIASVPKIMQSQGKIEQTIIGNTFQGYTILTPVVTKWSDNVTVEESAVALKNVVGWKGAEQTLCYPLAASSEVFGSMTMYHYNKGELTQFTINGIVGSMGGERLLLMHFDRHPAVHVITSGTNTYEGLVFDVDNYTILDNDTLFRYHDAVTLSLLGVPI